MQFAQGNNPTYFICFGIKNLSKFAVVKSLPMFIQWIIILFSFQSKF